MRCDSSAPMPATGSSSSSSRGRVASAMAISSWRCSPCASVGPRRRRARRARPRSRTRGPARAAPLGARGAPEAEAVAGVGLHGQRDVVERAEVAKDAGDLERAGQAALRARGRDRRGDVRAGEADRARVGAQVAGELADERRLAGAVGADDRQRLALGHVEVDAVGGDEAAEALGEPAHHEERLSHRGAAPGSRPIDPRRA